MKPPLLLWALLALTAAVTVERHRHRGHRQAPQIFQFTRAVYNVTIPENARGAVFAAPLLPPGERMGISLANQKRGRIRFRIMSGDGDNNFKAEFDKIADFAYLRVRVRPSVDVTLNRELKASYTLLISAKFATRQGTVEARCTVHVLITDENDLRPMFTERTYRATIDSDISAFSNVLKVAADDADEGINAQIVYMIQEPTDNFALHPQTGQLSTVRSPLSPGKQQLSVRAVDLRSLIDDTWQPLSPFQVATIEIEVRAANQHRPRIVITDNSGQESLLAGVQQTQAVLSFKVSDADQGTAGSITSVRLDNDADAWFALRSDDDNGQYIVETLSHVDLPARALNVSIYAQDGGRPPLSARQTIIVTPRLPEAQQTVCHSQAQAFTVNETLPVWSIIGFVRTEPEMPAESVEFFIDTDNDTPPFAVNRRTGALTIASALDAERRQEFTFDVLVRANAEHAVKCTMHVKVLDENDNTPQFVGELVDGDTITVPKTSSKNNVIGRVKAQDTDSNDNSRLTYRLLNDTQLPFVIDHWTGEIRLTDNALFNERKAWTLRVRASDSGRPMRRETEMTLTVQREGSRQKRASKSITIVNRHAPTFAQRAYAASVPESATIGKVITTVRAADADFGYNGHVLHVIEPEGNEHTLFNIDANTGNVFVARSLKKHVGETFRLTIRAWDSADAALQRKFTTAVLEITVNDVNDHSPVFNTPLRRVHVHESTAVGREVALVQAHDVDLGKNGQIKYALAGSEEYFAIHEDTGAITLRRALDRETASMHQLIVIASDLGEPIPMSGQMTLQILVDDANDSPPRCAVPAAMVHVQEYWADNALLTCVHAIDDDAGDNSRLTYAWTRSDADAPFRITADTGCVWLRNASMLNYETTSSYNLSVEVTDNGASPLSTTCHLVVVVHDVNENMHAPKFEQFAMEMKVFENEPPHTMVGRVHAVDPEQPDITPIYRLIINDRQAKFSIDANGTVRTTERLDRERRAIYHLTVIAEDGSTHASVRLRSHIDVAVLVVDKNDHAPRPTNGYMQRVSVSEGAERGTLVATIDAIDPDLGPGLVYRIVSGDPQSFFTIDASIGVVALHERRLDREIFAQHTLIIEIEDMGVPRLTTVVHLIVDVEDVNDNAPAFAQKVYHFKVPAIDNGHALCVVRAFDADVGVNAQISYSITRQRGQFTINETTGEIFAPTGAAWFDSTHELEITARDNGQPAMSTTTKVVLTPVLLPSSSRQPSLRLDNAVRVRSDARSGDVVYQVPAEGDEQLWFSINDNGSAPFAIIMDKGELYLTRRPEAGEATTYELTVTVTNGRQAAQAMLTIQFDGIPRARPVFSSELYDFETPTIVQDSTVGQVDARLEHSGVLYSLEATESPVSQDLFRVEARSGRIIMSKTVADTNEHRLIVGARAAGSSNERPMALSTVIVRNRDADSGQLRCARDRYNVRIPVTVAANAEIVRVTAADAQTNVRYELTTHTSDFAVDPVSGAVSVKRPPSAVAVPTTQRLHIDLIDTSAARPALAQCSVDVQWSISGLELAPVFEHSVYTVTIAEDSPLYTYVTTTAVNNRPAVTYRIGTGAHSNYYAINAHSGAIYTQRNISQLPHMHKITIVAEAAGLNDTAFVQIELLDANRHAPIFEKLLYEGSVQENAPAGTLVVAGDRLTARGTNALMLKAIDADEPGANSNVHYELVEPHMQQYFAVDYGTGAVRTKTPLDYETASSYTFTVRATDMGAPALSSRMAATVRVSVADINDSPPVLHLPSRRLVLTLPTVKGVKVARLTATDPDTIGTLHYAIHAEPGSPINNLFAIDETSGQISVATDDWRSRSSYSIPVEASDGVHVSTQHLRIEIDDRSSITASTDGLRFERQNYTVTIVENTTAESSAVLQLAVLGAEMSEYITYELLSPQDYLFLDGVSGELLTTGVAFDRERVPQLTLVAQARDRRLPPRVAHTLITIVVEDINDNAPSFPGSIVDAVVPLDASAGANVTAITATDPDDGLNAEIRYTLSGDDHFAIDSHSGLVSVVKTFGSSARTVQTYKLTVTAADMGTPRLSSQASLFVRAVDRIMPVFERQYYEISVNEAAPVNNTVTQLAAMIGSSDAIGYTITDGDDNSHFTIDFIAGTLRIARRLDREKKASYNLTIRATNLAARHVHSNAHVAVLVLDNNDNAPQFERQRYLLDVSEAISISTSLGKFIATDADQDDNARVLYTLRGTDSQSFAVDAQTGEIRLMASIDYESASVLQFDVVATDGGNPPLSGSAMVIINVLDANDQAPMFSQTAHEAHVRADAPQDTFIVRLTATDRDVNSTLKYAITDGDTNLFAIGTNTGVVTLRRVLPEGALRRSQYTLNISCSDGAYTAYTRLDVHVKHGQRVHTAPPAFAQPVMRTMVREDAVIGQTISRVTVSERGEPPVAYSLGGSSTYGPFELDAVTGVLMTRASLDRERQAEHRLPLVAVDALGRRAFASMYVTIIDVNDNQPTFVAAQYELTISTRTASDTTVAVLDARDNDDLDTVEYSLVAAADTEIVWTHFRVDARSGAVVVRRSLRDLSGRTLRFGVKAADRGNPPMHQTTHVTVTITNEAVPQFVQSSYLFDTPEDASVGTVVGSVSCEAFKDGILYTILPTADASTIPFIIDADTGEIKVAQMLDAETKQHYRLMVTAKSKRREQLLSMALVVITLRDVNDNKPVFLARYSTLTVTEDSPVGTSIAVVSARDDDRSEQTIDYSIESDDRELLNTIALDTSTGWLTLKADIDRERRSSYEFTVRATDNGVPSLSSRTDVRIEVTDINDNAPQFARDVCDALVAQIDENSRVGTSVLTLSVSDADLPPHNVTRIHIFDGDPQNHFAIRGSDSTLYINKPLNYEAQSTHELTLLATDSVHQTTCRIRIGVNDVSDQAPVCAQERDSITVSEAATPGTDRSLYKATVTDADNNDQLAYHIELKDGGATPFDINSNGQLVLIGALDRETQEEYTLKLVATDLSGGSCTTELHVAVTDVNDNAPQFESDAYQLSVSEDALSGEDGALFLTQLKARDPDMGNGGHVRYEIIGEKGPFAIDTQSGALLLTSPLDRETTATYKLTVKATDGGRPQLQSTVSVNVTVTDVNDSPPKFEQRHYIVNISEAAKIGYQVLKVAAPSFDDGANGEVRYHLHATPDVRRVFQLDILSGVVTLIDKLDYELMKTYAFSIEAIDGGEPPLSDMAQITIHIVDENDNVPRFSVAQYSAHVVENAPLGLSVVKVHASDADSGSYGTVRYRFSAQQEQQTQFEIDSESGQITVGVGRLDRETRADYRLLVEGCDSEERCDAVAVSIIIDDINDNAPIIDTSSLHATVQEGAPIGHVLLALAVSDRDGEGNAGPFSYELRGAHASSFTIDTRGILRTARRLRYDEQASFNITVIVNDAGTPQRSSNATVTVQVLQESKHPPVVSDMSIAVNAYLGEFAGAALTTVRATDKDENDMLTYRLVPTGNELTDAYFKVDAENGTLWALRGLPPRRHSLNISVTDGKFATFAQFTVSVNVVTEEVLEYALSMLLAGVSARDFISKYESAFAPIVTSALGTQASAMRLISVQDSQSPKHAMRHRRRSDSNDVIAVLFAVAQGDSGYFKPAYARRILDSATAELRTALGARELMLTTETCRAGYCNMGACHDLLLLSDTEVAAITAGDRAFVSPRHERSFECQCNDGYSGARCNFTANACAHRPCKSNDQLCVPMEDTKGYKCLCQQGRSGPNCAETCSGAECEIGGPLTFTGRSYMRYALETSVQRRLLLRMEMRTMAPNGVLMIARGHADWHALEVRGGLLQYQWDAGAGIGRALIADTTVNDGAWHTAIVERRGRYVRLSLDGVYSAEALSPGTNEVVNLRSQDVYFGADVKPHATLYGHQVIEKAFVGCIGGISVDGYPLPRAPPFRMYNVRTGCADDFIKGVCASQPCHNFGQCTPTGTEGGYTCSCGERYAGANCELDLNPCASKPCQNGATCENMYNDYFCRLQWLCAKCIHFTCFRCLTGWTGKQCDQVGAYDACLSSPCGHHGQCVSVGDDYICNCTRGWSGIDCNTPPGSNKFVNWIKSVPPEYIAAVGLLLLVLIPCICCVCCLCKRRRHAKNTLPKVVANGRKKRRQRTVNDDLLYDERMPHNSNPQVQQICATNNVDTPPPLPPRAGRATVFQNRPGGSAAALPTAQVRPISLADRQGALTNDSDSEPTRCGKDRVRRPKGHERRHDAPLLPADNALPPPLPRHETPASYQWDDLQVSGDGDWRSTLSNGDVGSALICVLDDEHEDDVLPTTERPLLDSNEQDKSILFNRRHDALQKHQEDSDKGPVSIVAPSALAEDEYVTMHRPTHTHLDRYLPKVVLSTSTTPHKPPLNNNSDKVRLQSRPTNSHSSDSTDGQICAIDDDDVAVNL